MEKSDPDEKFNASTESNLTEEKSADTVTSKSDQMDISLEESQSAEDHSIEKVGNSSKIQPILLLDENACDGVDHEEKCGRRSDLDRKRLTMRSSGIAPERG